MKRLIVLLACLLLCCPALAETPPQPNPEGWRYMGYTPAGVTFLIPADTQLLELTAADRAAGILMMGMNEDYTVQLRRFEADEMTLTRFRFLLMFTSGAQMHTRMDGDVEIVCYRNTTPTAVSELYGIALTGTDGCMYKVSIFTGVAEDYAADAPVWEIAEQIAQSVSIVDYSAWPLTE